jgi:hypothetical protein
MFVPKLSNDKKSSNYKVNFTEDGWEKISPNFSDMAFRNSNSQSIIFINSICDKYIEVDLNHLTDNILQGIENLKIEEKKEIMFADRKALRIDANGTFDGVPTFLDFLTLRKNNCVYDFVLVSSKKDGRQNDIAVFERLLQTVNIE